MDRPLKLDAAGAAREGSGNFPLPAHRRYIHLPGRTVTFTTRVLISLGVRLGGVYPTTFKALRHAAA